MNQRDTINDAVRDRDEYTLMRRVEHFVRKWSPPGRQGEFDADLFMLVRAIHADSAKPFEATVRKVMGLAMPLASFSFAPIVTKEPTHD